MALIGTGGLGSSPTSITIDLRGDEEVRALIDALSGRELQNRTRRATRAGVAVMRPVLRARAKEPRYPSSYAETIKTRGHRDLSTSVGPTTSLLNIFEGGAGRHTIAPRHRPVLANPEAARPFFSAGPVSHPGVRAIPIIGPVFEETREPAAEAALDKLMEGIR